MASQCCDILDKQYIVAYIKVLQAYEAYEMRPQCFSTLSTYVIVTKIQVLQ